MEVRIRTLTPIWTGGVDGTMDRIHETAIIGSLRWWYEAIVRGLGGSACDPSRHACPDKNGNYCEACAMFGATGRRRRFSMKIVEDETRPAWEPRHRPLNIRPPERTRGWYLLPGHVGSFTLDFHGDENAVSTLASLLLGIEKYGSIGGRPQLGYGAFRILNRDEVIARAGESQWADAKTTSADPDLPDLRRFVFFQYEFTPSQPGWWTKVPGVGRVGSQVQALVTRWHMVPTTPALKNQWRFHRWRGSRSEETEIFGTLRPKRRRGRIGATWAYRENGRWRIHGWAWMPGEERLARQIWQILADRHTWEQVLGVEGKLSPCPKDHWHERTSEKLAQLLQGVCHD